jgi:hypothetical protein
MLSATEFRFAVVDFLTKEIKWHRTEGKGKSGRGRDFEDGFAAGLKHAKNIVRQRVFLSGPEANDFRLQHIDGAEEDSDE